MSFIYSFFLFCFVLAYLPFFFFSYFKKGKYKGKLKEKLGFKKHTFEAKTPTLWLHAVSVGEIKAASSFLKKFKRDYPHSCLIVSSVTQTGHEEAKRCCKYADYHVLMPLDFKGNIKRLLSSLKTIDLVLLVETDLWPNFLKACKQKGAQIGIINAKLSKRSFGRLKKVPFFTKWYFSRIDFLLVQDEVYKTRFSSLGFKENQLQVVPNIKLDDVYPKLDDHDLNQLKKRFGIEQICLTLGSTHPGEEKELLEALMPLLKAHPTYKVLLVPRHSERSHEVELLLKSLGLSYGRYTHNEPLRGKQVILIDTIGFLRTCYQLSTLAIVAGSFSSKVGGHNILEPLWYSVPCLYGPYMHAQSQFVHLVEQAGAGEQVEVKNLEQRLSKLLQKTALRQKMGKRGRSIFDEASGGTDKTLRYIKKVLEVKGTSD